MRFTLRIDPVGFDLDGETVDEGVVDAVLQEALDLLQAELITFHERNHLPVKITLTN